MALTIVSVLFLLALLPERVRVLPGWAPYLIGMMVLVPTAAVGLTRGALRWLRIERWATLVFFVVAGTGTVANLASLIRAMVEGSTEVNGLEMLASSIFIWVTIVLAFSLLYWQLDRGGPEARLNASRTTADWLFPQAGVPDVVGPDWRPTFVDYLFLGFSTATAFSTTDALPLTSRAKLLMMVESSLSLVNIIVVAARSINILGG